MNHHNLSPRTFSFVRPMQAVLFALSALVVSEASSQDVTDSFDRI